MNRTPWWGRIFSIATATSWGGYTLDVNLFTLGTYSEETGGLEPAWGTNARLYDRNVELAASVTEIGDEFDPAMGFVRRRGTRVYKLDADYVPYHDNIDWLRNTRHGYEAEVFTDLGNDVVNTKQQFEPRVALPGEPRHRRGECLPCHRPAGR